MGDFCTPLWIGWGADLRRPHAFRLVGVTTMSNHKASLVFLPGFPYVHKHTPLYKAHRYALVLKNQKHPT